MNLSGKYLGAIQPRRIAPRSGLLMNPSDRRFDGRPNLSSNLNMNLCHIVEIKVKQ